MCREGVVSCARRAYVSFGLAHDGDTAFGPSEPSARLSAGRIHSLGCKSRERVKGARLPQPLGRADGVLEVEFYPSTCILAHAKVPPVADEKMALSGPSAMLTPAFTT